MSEPRKIFLTALIVAGFIELAMIPVIDVPAAAALFAIGFLAIAWSCYRHMRTAPAVIGILLLILDGGGTPFYQRTTWVDWLVQMTFAALCLTGVVSGVLAVRTHRRVRSMRSQSDQARSFA